MNDPSLIFIVVPVYNERSSVSAVVADLNHHGYNNIIVVDDGSSDNIREELNNQDVYFMRHSINLGQGAALQTGFEFAMQQQADVVVTFDGDGQHHAYDIASLIAPIMSREADVVLGSRFLTPQKTKPSVTRRMLLKTACVLNWILSGIFLSDAHNGLRGFNAKALEHIRIKENRMAHASELLFLVKKFRLKYMEVPVNVTYTSYSNKKGQSNKDSIRILFDLLFNKLFN